MFHGLVILPYIYMQHLDQSSYSDLDGCTVPHTAAMEGGGSGTGERCYENLNTTATNYSNLTYYVDYVP